MRISNPQGIGCFDGFFDGWIVENNVVIVDHYHGISFYGMRNSFILNNTVVANNIVYRSISVSGDAVEERNNDIIGRNNSDALVDFFVDPDNNDLHLIVSDLTTANIIDQGETFEDMVSSTLDRDGQPRVTAPDLGAYEMN